MSDQNPSITPQNTKVNLMLDLRVVVIVLLVAIIAMIIIWKPWSSGGTTGRTVQVTGDATITAKPDEYVFSPSYQFKNADKAAALAELSSKSAEVVAKLKTLGVTDNKIKTDSSGYDYPIYYDSTSKDATYTLQMTITTDNLALTQKVQDYLLTTSPTGSVSPDANFSDKTRKKLESQARDEATKDARAKGDQMAKNLGFKIGKVKAIEDDSGFDTIMPMTARGETAVSSDTKSLPVQPGENDLDYSVTVTYFIR